jgi:hypothetical protein
MLGSNDRQRFLTTASVGKHNRPSASFLAASVIHAHLIKILRKDLHRAARPLCGELPSPILRNGIHCNH